jgi:hypothetical protein
MGTTARRCRQLLLVAAVGAFLSIPCGGGVVPVGYTDLYAFENLEDNQSVAIVTVAGVSIPSLLLRQGQSPPPRREYMRLELQIEELLVGQLSSSDIVLVTAPVVPCGDEWCYVSTEGRYALQRGDRVLLVVQRMTSRDGFRFGEHFVRFERFLAAGALSDTMALCKKRNWVEWTALGGNSSSHSFNEVMEAMRGELRPSAYRLGDVRRALSARRETK